MNTTRDRARPLDLTTPVSAPARVLLAGFDTGGGRVLAAAASDETELVIAPDADALQRALREPVDAVVCDARLTPDAALAALASVRERDWAIPAVVLVARLDSETAAEAHRIGATSILRAPFTAADVLDAIAALRD